MMAGVPARSSGGLGMNSHFTLTTNVPFPRRAVMNTLLQSRLRLSRERKNEGLEPHSKGSAAPFAEGHRPDDAVAIFLCEKKPALLGWKGWRGYLVGIKEGKRKGISCLPAGLRVGLFFRENDPFESVV